MRVRFTPTAKLQFLDILTYIKRDKPMAAVNFSGRVEKSLSGLEKFPDSGRPLPEFPELPFREVMVPPYRFFYRVKGKTVWVVGAWHSAQLPEDPEL
ncbi:MAG: type II toxin-antitoxin system RelE/ParE family toxin [Candidatus Eisenbacteria bacterium]|uniref:Type II toxin-antitoxin system RelE/ParE family toxin n=1 Tax=Eiseniibacteriota bacterium TaxID=2212470 RepID=A0A948W1Y3_UNCEI|nr:type II toxin-antitoxin system RelE/ParE family toxin [Candidatus Eisenbacteria bacterium]MBU1947621.1 type II toxin-antitoxin system RelE/ParE family toxin [Candidatus Eisenbacteria bacterium]MBU2689347.1 type II toxin-antitoxin system RelE/ParE family toxin [Candidatus Eisenbacteria bacterium]